MTIYEIISRRKSIRKYEDKPVPADVLDRILDAGRMANSARNRQEWAFMAVTDAEIRKALVPACRDQKFVAGAGAVIAICSTESEYIMACGVPAYAVDCSIAADHIQLAACAEGLGTCWLGAFYQDKVKEVLDIPENIKVVAVLTIGYPAEEGRPKTRKEMGEILFREKWGRR